MLPIETRVESVTLYHRGATVRRVAELDFSSGVPPELFLAGLPLSLVDASVRVRLEAEGQMLLLSNVRVGLHAPPRGTPPPLPEVTALLAVGDALTQRRDRIEQLEREMQRLVDVNVLPRPEPEEGKMPPPAPMAARVALEALFEDSVSKRVALVRAARDEVKQLELQQAELQRILSLATTASHVRPDELTKSVHATLVAATAPKRARLVVEYFVVGARWAPSYQCRMTRDCTQADLQMRALVCQRTGEDWRGVSLLLSTAAPMSWTELPELGAIRIGRAQPPPSSQRGFRPPPQGAASLFQDYDRGLSSARAALPVIPSWEPPSLEAHVLPQASFGSAGAGAGPGSTPSAGALYDEVSRSSDESESLDDGVMMERAKESVSPRRAMAPAMMAPPAPPPPPMSMSMPSPGAPMRSMKKSAKREESSMDREEAPASRLDVLLYASLRLGGPEGGARGSLTPVNRRQALTEGMQRLGLYATFDVLAFVERAEAQGNDVLSLSPPPGTIDVRAEAGWYDYVYPTDANVDVPSDGTFHSVPVGTRAATSEVLYVTVPREDPAVYRQAEVRNPISSPLLPGPVEVSVGGEYVLTTAMPLVAPGADFKLSLGVEQGLKVARNTKYSEQRSGDKVVATNELIHELDFEVVNNLERPAKCEVRERLPQPAPEAEVVVEEGPVKPPWVPYLQEERGRIVEGGRRWLFTVKPGATQKLSAQYRVKLYANNELVGGNRREA